MARKNDGADEEPRPRRSRSSDSSGSSGDSITKRPIFQKAFGILILLAMVAFVVYLLYKSGALQKIPLLGKLFSKG